MNGHHLVLCDGPGSDVRAFRGTYARYLASSCRELIGTGARFPEHLRGAHERVVELLRRAIAIDEGQVLHCFASPAVATPLHCIGLRNDLPEFRARIDDAVARLLPHLLFEMALRGLLDDGEQFVWEHGAPRLASLDLGGEIVAPEAATGLVFAATHLAAVAGGAEIARLPLDGDGFRTALEAADGFRLERRYHSVGGVTQFATVDQNPIAAFEAHPDKQGNAVDLGGRPEAEWIAALDQSFGLVETFLPQTFAEIRLMLQEVVPVGYDDVRHLSASYREAIGTIYMTLHPNVMTMTEAVLHEFQHNKINVASYELDFLENAFHPLYKSPVRPDPRPLWGILLAVHAFLPVAELLRRIRDGSHPLATQSGFDARVSEIDLKNHEGMDMLRANAKFTPAGRALFGELEEMERRHLAERTARGLSNVASDVHLS